ncbi:MAG: Sensor histidine kinase RcsC [Myxococcota bacterium]|nr:Sensor histidine kinase RcsC [Myxococcota bacterium]
MAGYVVLRPSSVLIVDDLPDNRLLVRETLERAGYLVREAESGQRAIEILEDFGPDLIILDLMMPGEDGIAVCKRMRASGSSRFIPILFLSAESSEEEKVRGLMAGGDDFMHKPFSIRELTARVDRLVHSSRAWLDANPTTLLPGPGGISQKLRSLIQQGKPFAVGYVDLDNFKAFNDRYGFVYGDQVIRSTGQMLRDAAKEADPHGEAVFTGHIGGDDFVFMSPPEIAESLANDIVRRFRAERSRFHPQEDVRKGYFVSVTRDGRTVEFPLIGLSIGIVTRPVRDIEQISQLAAGLKKIAKQRGGNCVLSDASLSSPDLEAPPHPAIVIGCNPRELAYPLRRTLDELGLDSIITDNGPDTLKEAHRHEVRAVWILSELSYVAADDVIRLLQAKAGELGLDIKDLRGVSLSEEAVALFARESGRS